MGKEAVQYVTYVSAEKTAEKQGTWFPKENEHKEWQIGA